MNRAHLSDQTPTLFETLDDAELRTAGTTYLMYRGRHRHEPQRDTALTRIASALMPHAVMGPRELFYADIFASRRTGCRSGLGMPGVRDRHSGCVSAYMVEHDLFDFLLLSLPDNDWHSHKHGPDAQVQSIGQADLQLARMMNAAGGVDEFLAEHAVIAMADHSQAPVTATIALQDELDELGVLGPVRSSEGSRDGEPRIAVCPSQRAAMVYALNESERDAMRASVVARALAIDGVDLVLWLERDAHDAPREGVIASPLRGELRFAPGGPLTDARGVRLEPRRSPRRARSQRPGRAPAEHRLPRRARAGVGGAHLPDLRRGAAVGRARLRVHRLGAPGARRRWQPRLAARERLARRADPQRRRAARPRARTVGDPRRRADRVAALRRRSLSSRYPRVMRCRLAILASMLACLLAGLLAGLTLSALPASAATATSPAPAALAPSSLAGSTAPLSAATSATGSTSASAASSTATDPETPIPVAASNTPPAGRRLSANAVLAIAERLPKMRAVRVKYPGSYGGAYLKGAFKWQVSYFSKGGKQEIGQVIVDDLSGRVIEQWTGFQIAWSMARGYPGAFGRHVNALYIWLPLCALFMLPFLNFRRPFSLLHLDLLVLLSFSVSLAFFNHGHIYGSVPLAYPPLLYLLARMLALLRRPHEAEAEAEAEAGVGVGVGVGAELTPAAARRSCACSCRPRGWRSASCSCSAFASG